MSKPAEQAARKIAEEVGFDPAVQLNTKGLTVAGVIAKEYEPVMEVLREVLMWSNHRNAQGEFCRVCHNRYALHADDCWVSRARKIIGEE